VIGKKLAHYEIVEVAPVCRKFEEEYLLRGRVHEALGEREAAVSAYATAVDPITLSRGAIIWGTLGFYDLARAEENAGHPAAAREHYETFLARWNRADPEVPWPEDARRRLAKRTN